PARAEALRHPPVRGGALVGEHLHAEPFPEGDEPVEQRLGPEPLGDGGERVPAVHEPCAGVLVVPHVRQGQDDAAPGLQIAEDLLLSGDPHPAEDALAAVLRKPEHLEPVAEVGAQDLLAEDADLVVDLVLAEDAAQVLLQLPHPGAVAVPGAVGQRGEGQPGGGLGHLADDRPARRVGGVHHLVPQRRAGGGAPGPAAPAALGRAGVAHGAGSGAVFAPSLSAPSLAWAWTAANRCATVTVLRTARTHSATART